MIGIGGSLAAPPLPHTTLRGSVYGRFEKFALTRFDSNDSNSCWWAFGFMHHRERFDVFPQRLPGFHPSAPMRGPVLNWMFSRLSLSRFMSYLLSSRSGLQSPFPARPIC